MKQKPMEQAKLTANPQLYDQMLELCEQIHEDSVVIITKECEDKENNTPEVLFKFVAEDKDGELHDVGICFSVGLLANIARGMLQMHDMVPVNAPPPQQQDDNRILLPPHMRRQ